LNQGLGVSEFYDNEEVEMAVREILTTQEICIYRDGIFKIL
jgi:hypothetical protein